ncbi:4a-hydroxytetrahydrobiopterin dehydratase [soil metagenome]
MTERLSDIAIQRALGTINGWSRRNDTLVKTFTFRTFPEAIGFVNRVAGAAETADHHPDLDIRFNKISVALSTHSAGGITQKDFDLAAAMDELEVG